MWGSWGGGVALPSRLRGLEEPRELPQWGSGRSPGRQRILGIFQGLRSLLVGLETMRWFDIVMCEKLLDVPSAN